MYCVQTTGILGQKGDDRRTRVNKKSLQHGACGWQDRNFTPRCFSPLLSFQIALLKRFFRKGKGGCTKSDEFSEKTPNGLRPPPHFRKIILQIFYPACSLRALGLLLADGAPAVGWGKTFWYIVRVLLKKRQ